MYVPSGRAPGGGRGGGALARALLPLAPLPAALPLALPGEDDRRGDVTPDASGGGPGVFNGELGRPGPLGELGRPPPPCATASVASARASSLACKHEGRV